MNHQSRLLLRTHELLQSTEHSLQDIALATGISLYWLQKFKADPPARPNVVDVEALYTHLSGKKLEV
jgi:hypothetical protein